MVNWDHEARALLSHDCERVFPVACLRIHPRSPQASHPRMLPPLAVSRYFGRGSGAVFCHSTNEPVGKMQRLCNRSIQNGEVVRLSERALNRRRLGSLNPPSHLAYETFTVSHVNDRLNGTGSALYSRAEIEVVKRNGEPSRRHMDGLLHPMTRRN
jgi:hypothetical protein